MTLEHCISGRSLGTCISKFQLLALFLLHKIKDATLPSESRQSFLSSIFKKIIPNKKKKRQIFSWNEFPSPTGHGQGCVRQKIL